jgi:hypothetical protein
MVVSFTLIVWLYVGEIYEEVRVPNLGAEECLVQLFEIHADRSTKLGQCVGTKGVVLPRTMGPPRCARIPTARAPGRYCRGVGAYEASTGAARSSRCSTSRIST